MHQIVTKEAFVLTLLSTLLSTLAAARGSSAADPPLRFIAQHCSGCHSGNSSEGGFRADQLSGDLANPASRTVWDRILARVENGEMPPADASDRPAASDLQAALRTLKQALNETARLRRGEGGRVRLRRLNRVEYENTIRDLLAIDTPLRDLLPEDELIDGFNNQSAGLSISPVHIQQYMAAADRAIEAATVRQAQPETKTYRFSYNHEAEKYFHGHAHNKLQCNLRGDDLHFFLDTHIEVPAYLRQFEAITRDTPGRYRIRISTEARDTASGEDLIFSVWLAAGGKRRELLGHFDAKHRQETTIELTRPFERGETIIVAPWRMAKLRIDAGYSVYLPDKQEKIPEGWHHINNPNPPIPTVGPAIVVRPIEITGPLQDTWPPAGHQLLYGERAQLTPAAEVAKTAIVPNTILNPPQRQKSTGEFLTIQLAPEVADVAIRETLTRFIGTALRRPARPDEIDLYHELIRDRLARSECLEVAMNAAHRAILCSPEFLFLIEDGQELNDHQLASRLSYFLWRSAPDKQLRTLADQGQLSRSDVMRSEVDRLLNSSRFQSFVDDFSAQWLNLREIDATTPDRDLFPEYFEGIHEGRQDVLLHDSIVQETRTWLHDLIITNADISQMVSAPYAFLNQRLAEHYDLPPVQGASLRRVPLPADSVRGGLLTQASILKVTANGANTSPVLRGAWLLDRIIGSAALPPPPDAGGIEPDTRGAVTIREQLAKHQSSKNCAGCHRKIDPPGFALEAFDPIGRHRDYYRTTETGEKLPEARVFYGGHYGGVKYLKGPPVDTHSQLPDGSEIADVRALKRQLAAQPELLARNLVRRLATFATGNRVESGDELGVDLIMERSATSGFGVRTLIHEVVQSELFTQK